MTALRAPQPTVDAKRRSLELVAAHGYQGMGPWRTVDYTLDGASDALISLTIRVPSASGGEEHVVTYRTVTDDAQCDCPASRYHCPCFHRGVGLQAGRYVARRAALGWPED